MYRRCLQNFIRDDQLNNGFSREMMLRVIDACKKEGYISSGDLVVVVGGFLEEKIGTTNMINLHTVE